MTPIMREPTGLIIVPLRTEPPPPAVVAATAAAVAPSVLGPPHPAPSSRTPDARDPGPPLAAWTFALLNSEPTYPLHSDTAGQRVSLDSRSFSL